MEMCCSMTLARITTSFTDKSTTSSSSWTMTKISTLTALYLANSSKKAKLILISKITSNTIQEVIRQHYTCQNKNTMMMLLLKISFSHGNWSQTPAIKYLSGRVSAKITFTNLEKLKLLVKLK